MLLYNKTQKGRTQKKPIKLPSIKIKTKSCGLCSVPLFFNIYFMQRTNDDFSVGAIYI